MALTESQEDGGWEYWIFLVLVYGSASVALAWRQAKRRGEPVWKMIRKQVLHWFGALITLAYAEQYTVWLILIPAAAGVIWLHVKLRTTRSD